MGVMDLPPFFLGFDDDFRDGASEKLRGAGLLVRERPRLLMRVDRRVGSGVRVVATGMVH